MIPAITATAIAIGLRPAPPGLILTQPKVLLTASNVQTSVAKVQGELQSGPHSTPF